MEALKVIAMLCQLTCGTSSVEAQKQQVACHQFYAQCVTEEKRKFVAEPDDAILRICMDQRFNRR